MEIKVLHALKLELKQDLASLGCPAHILHSRTQHGAHTLSVDLEYIIMKIYNYFSVYTVRTEDVKSSFEFVDINGRQLLSHSRTRWLSLFPAVERLLQMFPAVKSFFSPSVIHQ
jgi:hypothetical protein